MMSKMKALARSHVWWPSMDSEIELCVRSCASCQAVKPLCQEPHCIHGYGQLSHGSGYIWILWGLSVEKCGCYWLIVIPNGQKCFR